MRPPAVAELQRRVAALEALLVDPPAPPPTELLPGPLAPSLRDIGQAVCGACGVSLAALLSERRAPALVEARQMAWWLARELTPHSLPAIGRTFRRDHSTVIHGLRRIAERMQAEPALAARVARLRQSLSPLPPTEEA